VDFSSKIVIVDGKPVQLQIWDTVSSASFSVGKIFTRLLQTTFIEEQLQFFLSMQLIIDRASTG
jgi:hypothetical protein